MGLSHPKLFFFSFPVTFWVEGRKKGFSFPYQFSKTINNFHLYNLKNPETRHGLNRPHTHGSEMRSPSPSLSLSLWIRSLSLRIVGRRTTDLEWWGGWYASNTIQVLWVERLEFPFAGSKVFFTNPFFFLESLPCPTPLGEFVWCFGRTRTRTMWGEMQSKHGKERVTQMNSTEGGSQLNCG